jgi:hypothetical protein
MSGSPLLLSRKSFWSTRELDELSHYNLIHDGATTATPIPDAGAVACANAGASGTFLARSGSTVSWSPGILSASGEAATFVSRSKITANLTLYTITIWADPIYSCTAFITTSRAFEPFRKHISATYISRAILKRPYHTRFEPPVAL